MNLEPIEETQLNQHIDPSSDPSSDLPSVTGLLGALDIVESFTALRHELKLQVRDGRQLQQTLGTSLQRMDERITALQHASSHDSSAEGSRDMALALAEIEESLQRAVETISQQAAAHQPGPPLLESFDRLVAQSSWLTRKFAYKLIQASRDVLISSLASNQEEPVEILKLSLRGLELLLDRVHRLMQQNKIVRVDVQLQPFNAETMHAVDVVQAIGVPSCHVAEQLRPGYLWKEKLLRCADVRLAK